ncbi:hypothetical protein D3C75_1288820 [compost metagenome]
MIRLVAVQPVLGPARNSNLKLIDTLGVIAVNHFLDLLKGRHLDKGRTDYLIA